MPPPQMEQTPRAHLPPLRDTELVPGTELMIHDGESNDVQATGNAFILVPQPSLDPADPLNWSMLRKGKNVLAIASIALYSFLTTNTVSAMAPMYPLFAETFSLSATQVPLITGVTVMVLGFSNLLAVPFSKIFGRRAAALTFGVLYLVTCIWQAVAKTYGSFMAARAITGIAAAPSETLMVQVVADLFFIHERGSWMGVYFASVSLGAFIGPVISGNIAERYGWRSFFWLSTGLFAFSLALVFLLFPETKYDREQMISTSGDVVILETTKPGLEANQAQHVEVLNSAAITGKGRPNSKQFLPFQRPHPRWRKYLLRDIIGPARAAILPIVLFAGLNVMGAANMVLYWNITESGVLSQPPYNFSVSQVGFSNFGLAGGALFGMVTGGLFSDWLVKQATARNNGLREAEMRLPALIPFAIITIIGTVLGGLTMTNGWDWPILVVVGFGSAGVALSTVPTITVAYAIDAYKPISGEIMIVATILKNVTGFGMTYWLEPLVVKHGYMLPLMVWFVFTIGPMLLAIPLYFWGKKLRVATKDSRVHRPEEWL
ncbi:hypothetical protein G7046_g2831 [Stylonectria norvegica]|nr:hypothetical protein G7046_g2831 [Stylonectria norvegica]